MPVNEATARRLVLVRAYDEAAQQQSPLWTPEDAQWATRLAGETAPAQASAAAFLDERAQHALQRIVPRDRGAARWLALAGWRWSWALLAVVAGFALGLLADVLGRSQLVDILAPPVWAVVAWNLLVYAVLAVAALRGLGGSGSDAPPGRIGGWLRRALAAAWQRSGGGAGPLRQASAHWATLAAPLTGSRVAVLLHVGAAAVAAGLIAGLYARGLVFDYRAGWQSTFLDAETVQRTLQLLMWPATALTGIAVPGIPAIAAMQITPAAPHPQASAAPWIHLYAATLVLVVIAPRLLLALAALMRSWWQAARLPLPLNDVYAQRLLRQRRKGVALVEIHPHAAEPSARAALAMRTLMAHEFGSDVQVHMHPATPLGEEDASAQPHSADAALHVLLADLGATPEPETHGRWVQAWRSAAPASPLLLLADEAAFARRFATLPQRLQERRAAWQALADAQGVPLLCADLEAPDASSAAAGLHQALTVPMALP